MPNAPRDQPAPLAVLGVHAGPRVGEELAVRSPVLTIGQGSQNDLVLDDDSVSTTHARLEYEAGGWRLTDLGSTNGTYVEGTRLAPDVPTPLAYGALVRFGGLTLQFREVATADPDAARARYAAPAAPAPARPRRARLPVWLFVLLLLVVVAIVFLVLQTQDAAVGAVEAAGPPYPLALSPLPPGTP